MLRDALWAAYPPEDCRCTWSARPGQAPGLLYRHKMQHPDCPEHGTLPVVPWNYERWNDAVQQTAGQRLPERLPEPLAQPVL